MYIAKKNLFFNLWINAVISQVPKNIKQQLFHNTDNNRVSNQPIRMIYEGSCDAEDWSNGWLKFSFASQNYIYIKNRKPLFQS